MAVHAPREPVASAPVGGARPPGGTFARSRLARGALVLLPAAVAINIAHSAGVVGKAAIPPLAQVGLAGVLLFALSGFGFTRLLLPQELRRYEALWVLPVGACVVALELMVLGYAHVPFHVSLGILIATGVVVGLFALLRGPAVEGRGLPALRRSAWPLYLAVLAAAIALIPLFRAGFPTVEGQGQDAHLAVGTAIFLERHFPSDIAPQEAVDRVPLVWRSKPPIYYGLAAVSTLSGKEVFETISTFAAMLLGLACLGFFLVAREMLRAPPWAACVAIALVALDRMVLHTVMHPYFNQTWGFFATPFAIVLAWEVVQRFAWRTLALLLAFLAVVAFAYPLALPIPLIPPLVFLWPRRKGQWRRFRALIGRHRWAPPATILGVLLLLGPIRGVIEKQLDAYKVVFNPSFSLAGWGGDLGRFFPEPQFIGAETWTELIVVAPILAVLTWRVLRGRPRALRLALGAVLAFGALFAIYFRLRPEGYYFHFKLLAYVGPLLLTIAAAGLGSVRLRVGAVLAVVLVTIGIGAANQELGSTFDELPKFVLALRSIDHALPPGQSIRLDVSPQEQNWVAFMLHGQPLCSEHPLLNTSYPHVQVSRRADYILTARESPRPADAATGPPVDRLAAYTLYRARPDLPGPDRCSQLMVQTVTAVGSG